MKTILTKPSPLGFLVLTTTLFFSFIMGCANEADKRFETAEDLYLKSVNYRKAGETDKGMQEFKHALNKYKIILALFPDQSSTIESTLYQIWDENYKLHEYEIASLVLEELVKNFPNGSWSGGAIFTMYNTALKNIEDKNYEDALPIYQELFKYFPKSDLVDRAGVWYKFGESNYQLKNYQAAREALKEFLKRFPGYSVARSNKARLWIAHTYRLERKYNQAYIKFDMLLSTEFDSYPQLQEEAMYYAAFNLKQLADDLKQPKQQLDLYDEALGRYAEFLTRFPNSKYVSDAYFDRGLIYVFNKKDYVVAHSNFDRALKTTDNPDRKAEIQLQIGYTYKDQDDSKNALIAYNQLLKEYEGSPQGATAGYMIAQIHQESEKFDKVVEAHESIIRNYNKDQKITPISITWDDGRPGNNINLIALSHFIIGDASLKNKDYEKAFLSNVKILKEPKSEDRDLRTDPSAPNAMHNAMKALNELWKQKEIGSEVQLILGDLLGIPPEKSSKIDIEEVLERFAGKYISSLRERNIHLSDDAKLKNTILSADAQFEFAKLFLETKRYDKAAIEFAKLQDYQMIPALMLDLIKLKSKYYEGICYSELSRTKDVKKDYAKDAEKAYRETITLFNAIFQPLIDIPNIDVPNIDKKVLDYCIQTAQYYVGNSYFATNQFEKAISEFEKFLMQANPESKLAKETRAKIKEAHQKLKDKTKEIGKSDASKNPDSSAKFKNKGQLTDQEIAEIAAGSTVFLAIERSGMDGSGSGFFVEPDQIATNYHVIKGGLRGTARLVGVDREYAIIGYTAIDADRDLAILKVRAFGVDPLVFGNSEKIYRGETVYAVGNPLGVFVNVVSDGKISSIQWTESILKLGSGEKTRVGNKNSANTPYKLLMMTAPISRGNSGGPVLNGKGEVIGVSVLTVRGKKNEAQNLNFAVPINYLKALLKRVGHPKPLSDL